MIYHVSVHGTDTAPGTASQPFRTINHAAQIAVAGDTIQVHTGVYREWVKPRNGGTGDDCRITYEAAPGESPVIKGSEVITDWEHVESTVYKKVIPNDFFGDFNPFAERIFGDWLQRPIEYHLHLGDVYINGKSMYEAKDMEALYAAEKREFWFKHVLTPWQEYILHPEDTIYQWHAQVDAEFTTIYANFQNIDPNRETIEINVRPCCFCPTQTGIGYITLRGFEIAHAATQFAPPTAEQIGMVGPNWSKGWIIENNHLHDAKCNAISLGKDGTTGNNDSTRFARKSGHCCQFESVFSGLRAGWCKEKVGSHIVRNNEIHDCGQTGIVGHMGCSFSQIIHNHIYNIAVKHEFMGSELAGIKFHAPIDVVIKNNNIHHCTLGTWLDWQVQGTRVTRNLYHNNDRDIHIEVTHGPCSVDNNLFLSRFTVDNQAQGTAYVHNLFAGIIRLRDELTRVTPYHLPHSTEVAGAVPVYGGDDRILNNLILGKDASIENKFGQLGNFSDIYDKYNTFEDYNSQIGDLLAAQPNQASNFRIRLRTPQPVMIAGNAYADLAKPFRAETEAIDANGTQLSLTEEKGQWTLMLKVPEAVAKASCTPVTAQRLGTPRITEAAYENPDGTPIDFAPDFFGTARSGDVIPGPFAGLLPGTYTFTVWNNNQ